jgi:hypothetical protein
MTLFLPKQKWPAILSLHPEKTIPEYLLRQFESTLNDTAPKFTAKRPAQLVRREHEIGDRPNRETCKDVIAPKVEDSKVNEPVGKLDAFEGVVRGGCPLAV